MANEKDTGQVSQQPSLELYLRNLEQTLLNREWLETRTKYELMDLVLFLAVQLYKQSTSELRQTATRRQPDAVFPSIGAENLPNFEVVPANSDGKGERLKVLMVGSKTAALNRGYEIIDHAVLGREDGESNVDIDLTAYGPEVKGVSRRHAEFKIHDGKLFVVDLGSSNGTYLKGKRIAVGEPVEVPNGGVLSFGALHVQVQIFD